MDVSFSGVLSYVEKEWVPMMKRGEATAGDMCFSFQENLFAMLVEITERAMAHCGAPDVLVVGGVGCNLCLQVYVHNAVWVCINVVTLVYLVVIGQAKMEQMVKQRNGKLYATDDRYCIDNGAMIAYTGLLSHMYGDTSAMVDTTFTQRFRTAQVQCVWRVAEEGNQKQEIAAA